MTARDTKRVKLMALKYRQSAMRPSTSSTWNPLPNLLSSSMVATGKVVGLDFFSPLVGWREVDSSASTMQWPKADIDFEIALRANEWNFYHGTIALMVAV